MTLLAAEDTSSTTSARGGLTAHQVLLLAVAVFTARLNVEREAFVVEDGGELEAAAESVSHEGVALADGRLTGEGGGRAANDEQPLPADARLVAWSSAGPRALRGWRAAESREQLRLLRLTSRPVGATVAAVGLKPR
ncbi:MAG: hypothetical protein E6G53_06095 [Actinobacteria bacterium]|nr:MAG: hypothetical protein E6G53_06095 [Actinomycetota bacterium]